MPCSCQRTKLSKELEQSLLPMSNSSRLKPIQFPQPELFLSRSDNFRKKKTNNFKGRPSKPKASQTEEKTKKILSAMAMMIY